MKLRTRARYSLRMMMAITRLSRDGAYVGLGEVARFSGLSRRYLEQLAGPLRNAGLLRAQAGRNGGYVLARDARRIRLGQVVEAAIGPISVTDCLVDPEACDQSTVCGCCGLWSLINQRITQVLNDYSLAEMIADDWTASVMARLDAPSG